MSNQPWDFSEAREACRAASQAQHAAEDALREASKDLALMEEQYRLTLAKKIVELRAEGMPASVCADVARGDKDVAKLRMKRDIADGVREAAVHAAWRRAADRKDAQRFADWSQRREFAEVYTSEPEWSELIEGGRK